MYGQFIDIVAEGRKLPRSEVESLATGWAWNGEQAKELGLVDEIGTYRDAMKAAAKLGGIEGEYETVTYGSQKFEDLLSTLLGHPRSARAARARSTLGVSRSPGPRSRSSVAASVAPAMAPTSCASARLTLL